MLNIKTLAAADTGTLHLRNGDDSPLFTEDGKPVTITVYGPGSKPYAAAKAAQQNRLVARLQRKGQVTEDADQQAKHNAEFLAAITHSMEGLEYEGLAGRELFLAVYGDPSIGFVAEQVNKFAGDWANFSRGSAKS